MAHLSLEEIMFEAARRDARKVIKDGSTVYVCALNQLLLLKRSDANHNLDYFRRGRECFHTYTQALTEIVTSYFTRHDMKYTYHLPSWDDDALVARYSHA